MPKSWTTLETCPILIRSARLYRVSRKSCLEGSDDLSPGIWARRGKPHIVRQGLPRQVSQVNNIIGGDSHSGHTLHRDAWSTLPQQGRNGQAIIKVETSSDGEYGHICCALQKRRERLRHRIVLQMGCLDKTVA